jgi:putative phosphoribosyl transferase
MVLPDRHEAGRRLSALLLRYRNERPTVLALPRGGVPVAVEIAEALSCPLDILIVRKIGAPDNPEYGLGAVAEDGTRVMDEARIRGAGYEASDLDATVAEELAEISRRAAVYRAGKPPLELADRTVIIVDDGVATGVTVRAAVESVRRHRPRAVVLAFGACPPETFDALRRIADEVVVLVVPPRFFAVGEWYLDFRPVEDGEVLRLLRGGPSGTP